MSSGSTVARTAEWADDRLGLAKISKRYLRKVFPDHWSFMLGEIALWSFVVLLITGTFLTLWFTPSMSESTYEGSYSQLRGVPMSDAYASTLHISFDVRGGLLVRQMHHWAAMLFIAAMLIHMMRIFVTGAFRKPREVTWVIGATMLLLGLLEGFVGYSLPDDLLSGTGLRIADGLIKATPVVGTYLSFFLFGGEFPGDAVISRFYIVHVLLIPGILLALVGAHLLLIVYHKHTQWPGPGREETNVVGYPFLPVYLAKSSGFFLMVFGVTALMGGLLTINPLWKYGPYDPSKVTAGAQPDWYMAIAEGLLRIFPNWETHVGGHTISWNVLLPGQVHPLRAAGDDRLLAVHGGLGDRRPARAPSAPATTRRAGPDRIPGRDGHRLRPALDGRRQRHHGHPPPPEPERDHLRDACRGLRGPDRGLPRSAIVVPGTSTCRP